MAKKVKVSGAASADELLDNMLAKAESIFGESGVYVATEHEQRFMGIKIPHLCLMWLTDSNVFPLSKLIGCAGVFGSCKSAFTYQLMSWFIDGGGIAVLTETEEKASATLMAGMMGDNIKRVIYSHASTAEMWQRGVSNAIMSLRANDPKREYPVLLVVDSLTGNPTEETSGKIDKEGYAQGRQITDHANSISLFLKKWATSLTGWPITFMWTNHLKENLKSMIPGSMRKPGGSSQDFHAALDIWFKKIGNLETADRTGSHLELRVNKNSFGISHRKLPVDFGVWWEKGEGEERVFKASFDWFGATANLLSEPVAAKMISISVKKKTTKGVGTSYWCDDIGVDEENALSGHDFGKLIDTNHDLQLKLAKELNIQLHRVFSPGMEGIVPTDYVPTEEELKAVNNAE